MSLFSFVGFNVETAGVILSIIILAALFTTAGFFIGKSGRDKKLPDDASKNPASTEKSIIWDATSYKMLKEKLIEYDGSLKTDPGLPSIINNFIKQNPNLKISDLEKYSTKQSIDKIINDVRNRRLTDPGPPTSCTQGCDYKTCGKLDSCGNECGCKDGNECIKDQCTNISKWTPEIYNEFKQGQSSFLTQTIPLIKESQINCIVNNIANKFKSSGPIAMTKIGEVEGMKMMNEISSGCMLDFPIKDPGPPF